MKILILGAGQVGGTLAESLAKESFDITLIDQDSDRLRELGSRLIVEALQRRERLGLQLQLDAIKHLLGRRTCSSEPWPYTHSRNPAP